MWRAALRRAAVWRTGLLLASAIAAGGALAQSASKGDPARGAAKAQVCGKCHGTPDSAPLAETPSLAGQQPEFIVLQLFLIREGLRDIPKMHEVLKDVSDREFMDIAAYFASQAPLRAKSKADPKLIARGAELSKRIGCGSCHMPDYTGQRQVPRITGQREDYVATTLKAYRDNKRTGSDTSMNNVMYQVSDSDIQALAHYLAHQ